jgi:glycosyltransferase involved in cell wall biosynthesis
MRTYRAAHALAERGHEVHVVTNAKEVRPPFRMYMRAEDWKRCEARYGAGSVQVHWTDPIDRSQSHIPMASPFITKLATIAAGVHSENPFDVIYSHYLEPYGVAAHLAAQMTGVPHVARMAGSDAGRLWHHPQLEALYDHVLRSAEIVIATGTVAERAVERGIDPQRIAYGGQFTVPDDLFAPAGPLLDLPALRSEVAMDPDLRDSIWGEFAGDRPYFGICGKLGENKGSFALLAAMHRLKRAGVEAGLVALAHGQPAMERSFRSRARKLGLADRILQIPFLPHWRVPEFLRSCLAVCCLEQDFPIGFHTPMIPFEVLLCGTCLVASTEVITKLPAYGRLPHGHSCIAVEDVNDVAALGSTLAAIALDPVPAAGVGLRGRLFALELQRKASFPNILEGILESAALRERPLSTKHRSGGDAGAKAQEHHFSLTQLAVSAIEQTDLPWGKNEIVLPKGAIDLVRARQILVILEHGIDSGRVSLQPFALAVRIEISIAEALNEAETKGEESDHPLFRLHGERWAMGPGDLAGLVPIRDRQLRLLEFDHDIAGLLDVRTVAEFPRALTQGPSYIAVFGRLDGEWRSPLLIDGLTARILRLSDGTRTVSNIVEELEQPTNGSGKVDNFEWIESLFVRGLISLHERQAD